MTVRKKEFGFYPKPLEIAAGPIRIRPLQEHDTIVDSILSCDRIHDGWIYAPLEQVGNAPRRELYGARVFVLPMTHTIGHSVAIDDEHMEFHVWALSFFLGTRLSTTEPGYLDATPVEVGRLVDFVPLGQSLVRAAELAENFWMANRAEPQNAKRLEAAIHALFLSQYRQGLQFERFIYLYTAIDALFALAKSSRQPPQNLGHPDRIAWMCSEFGLTLPNWAANSGPGNAELPTIRNKTLHEGLFMDAPLGFALHGGGTNVDLTLEMTALVCRLLVALIGGNDQGYIGSRVDSRQRHGLNLS